MSKSLVSLRHQWSGSSIGCECSLHQLAPYIGKLKTSIARALVAEYSSPGSTVLEPFSGSGVVALEALLQERNIIANDISPYAAVLTRAKLFAPTSERTAVQKALKYSREAKEKARRDDWRVNAPGWVKEFFHRRTLSEVFTLAQILRRRGEWFLLACLLGILHHQRPGFLSFPSSHLVPYLRRKKFPKFRYPKLYQYRDVEPRLTAKVHRAYRRVRLSGQRTLRRFESKDIGDLRVDDHVDLVLTSPPYMNALDYGRDNRLRLWFIGVQDYRELDQRNCRTSEDYAALIGSLADIVDRCLSQSGRAVLVVGEDRRGNRRVNPTAVVNAVFTTQRNFRLIDFMEEPVPDIRRSRRGCAATKREWIMVFSRK
jgi:D12 class N6 adenine-specific DNA methyltransferase